MDLVLGIRGPADYFFNPDVLGEMKRLNWIVAVLMVVLLLSGAYVGAYFACSEYVITNVGQLTWGVRQFDTEWIAKFFAPMIALESRVRGMEVEAVFP